MAALLLVLFTGSVFGDGKVFPAIAFPKEVRIPDQSALLVWSNGVERLVIETRFVGQGTNFAWVVPLPSVPVIEPATTGLFPTLRHTLQPELVHDVYGWWALALFICGLVWLMATVRRDEPRHMSDWVSCLVTSVGFAVACNSEAVAVLGGPLLFLLLLMATNRVRGGKERAYAFLMVVFLVFFLASLMLPALGTAKSVASAGENAGLSLLERRIVGVFETTTIAAKEPDALFTWLQENGFSVASEIRPVMHAHVRDGWIFVAVKVRRDLNSSAPTAPHPLSFIFNTPAPVYPLRLTGAGGGEVWVELFVAAQDRAALKGFAVTECRRIERAPPSTGQWRHQHTQKFGHPLLLDWLNGASVITRLEARLDAKGMKEDARIGWESFRPVRDRRFSKVGAFTTAANWTVPTAAILVLISGLAAHRGWMSVRRATSLIVGTLLAASVLSVVVFASLAKVEVRTQWMPSFMARLNLINLAADCLTAMPTNQAPTAPLVRQVVTGLIPALDKRHTENILLGGVIREEDSPGNFSLRETEAGVEILGHDNTGAPVALFVVPKEK